MQTTVINGRNLRLSAEVIKVIKEKALEVFGKDVKVVLFGSRVEKDEKGGDIDLYIKVTDKNDLLDKEIKFLADVKRQIGDQKIDVIFNKDAKRLVECEALKKGIEL
ncbi:MAG: nucleotidyltransferase domain-containing protein [Candidatus Anammoxibacter sp.]